jgi:hypothetical protein
MMSHFVCSWVIGVNCVQPICSTCLSQEGFDGEGKGKGEELEPAPRAGRRSCFAGCMFAPEYCTAEKSKQCCLVIDFVGVGVLCAHGRLGVGQLALATLRSWGRLVLPGRQWWAGRHGRGTAE